MFSRRERLARALFPTALRGGRRVSSPHFSIIIPHGGKGYAVVVPKKVVRLSVTRHRIKRQVLSALRTLPLPASVIVFPRLLVHTMSYQDIRTELAGLLSHL